MWEKSEGEEGIFSGLFGIIEVRPSAGAHVGGALVLHRVGGNEGGAGLVPIRPEALVQFVCTGRTSQRRAEAA